MHLTLSRTLIICANMGNAIEYTKLMNELGFYRLTLCASIEEAEQEVKNKRRYDYLLYDDFSCDANGCLALSAIRNFFRHIILLANISEAQQMSLLRWAWQQNVPLLGLLPRPLELIQLESMVSIGCYACGGDTH